MTDPNSKLTHSPTSDSSETAAPSRPQLICKPVSKNAQLRLALSKRSPRVSSIKLLPEVSYAQRVALPSSIDEELTKAAVQLQHWFQEQDDIHYELPDLLDALAQWLEDSIEQLGSTAAWHCRTGCERYSFNRPMFQAALNKLNHEPDKQDTKADI